MQEHDVFNSAAGSWDLLPDYLGVVIFRQVLEQQPTLPEIIRQWETLALVSKGWHRVLQLVPLCLEFTQENHLGTAAQAWLVRQAPLEVSTITQ
jgi:hypothetical protein